MNVKRYVMKKRSEIEETYKWDLSSYIKDEKEIDKIFEIMKRMAKIYPQYNGRLGDKDALYEYLTKYQKAEIAISKLAHYLMNLYDVDSSNDVVIRYQQRFDSLNAKIMEANSFAEPQMLELSDKYINSLIIDERFSEFDSMFRDLLKKKKHKIDEKTNLLISKMSTFVGKGHETHSVFFDEQIKYEDAIDCNGNKHEVNNATSRELITGQDRVLRESAAESLAKPLKQFNHFLADLYLNSVKEDKFFSELTHYESVLDQILQSQNVPKEVFFKNIEMVKKYNGFLQKFVNHEKKLSGIEDFNITDLSKKYNIDKKFTITEMNEIICNALSPLGDEYVNIVKRKLNDHSIDYMPNENKYSGAYCDNCYGANTIILMNFLSDYYSIDTLAHEMGHCVNAEYFTNAQPRNKADVTIFAAEIASTVNEILLSLYLMNSADKNELKYHYKELFGNVHSAIFRQTLYSEFEYFVHSQIENEIPLTFKDLNEYYKKLLDTQYGNSCKILERNQYGWSRIPHFYRPYYVFSYSTGMITAIAIVSKILQDKSFVDKYIYFLKNGTNKPAFEILKEIGIDLSTDEPYNIAFEFLNKQLDEYMKI